VVCPSNRLTRANRWIQPKRAGEDRRPLLRDGFPTLVPEDAVRDQSQGPQDANLLDCQRRYAGVTTTDACIEYLRGRVAA
jgi:hypothetical protein